MCEDIFSSHACIDYLTAHVLILRTAKEVLFCYKRSQYFPNWTRHNVYMCIFSVDKCLNPLCKTNAISLTTDRLVGSSDRVSRKTPFSQRLSSLNADKIALRALAERSCKTSAQFTPRLINPLKEPNDLFYSLVEVFSKPVWACRRAVLSVTVWRARKQLWRFTEREMRLL